MSLTPSEKMDLFNRFKDKDFEKLMELAIRFKAGRKFEKAAIIDLILKSRRGSVEELKKLKKQFDGKEYWVELNFVNSVLEKKIEVEQVEKSEAKSEKVGIKIKKTVDEQKERISEFIQTIKKNAEKIKKTGQEIEGKSKFVQNIKKKADREKGSQSESSFDLSEEVCIAMKDRIIQDAKKHRFNPEE